METRKIKEYQQLIAILYIDTKICSIQHTHTRQIQQQQNKFPVFISPLFFYRSFFGFERKLRRTVIMEI